MPKSSLLTLLVLASCVIDRPTANVGACADADDPEATYGEIGIGTCLSGPVDLDFHVTDEATWLFVSNANPYHTYAQGSMLAIDFDSIDTTQPRVRMDQLTAHALPIETYLGEFEIERESQLAVVSSRLSPDSRTQVDDDRVWFVDVSDPAAMTFSTPRKSLSVRQDPFGVMLDEDTKRAFVVNMSDHSISIIDMSDPDLPQAFNPYPRPIITDPEFTPAEGSIGHAELQVAFLDEEEDFILQTDTWDATFVDTSWRAFLPQTDGLRQWSGPYGDGSPSGFGPEIQPAPSLDISELQDPYQLVTITEERTSRTIWFDNEGEIWLAGNTGGSAVDWFFDADPLLVPANGSSNAFGQVSWSSDLSGPANIFTGNEWLFFDAATDDGRAIGAALSTGNGFNAGEGPVLAPAGSFLDLAQPAPIFDTRTDSFRMWMSVRTADGWAIGLSEAPDAIDVWDPVELVDVPFEGQHGAPYVQWLGGRYQMYFSGEDETGAWSLYTAWSWDGRTWNDVEHRADFLDSNHDDGRVPRGAPALQDELTFRVTAGSDGRTDQQVSAGGELIYNDVGFSLQPASGFDVGTEALGSLSEGSIYPGGWADLDGTTALYVTGENASGRGSLSILALGDDDAWMPLRSDIIPQGVGGNIAGVSDPTVFPLVQGGQTTFVMLYAATDSNGFTTVRRATSPDGLVWTAQPGRALSEIQGWYSVSALPHSIEEVELDDGGTGHRLWFTGFDGNRDRIGSALSTDGMQTFTPENTGANPWVLSSGTAGEFDSAGVADPYVFTTTIDGAPTRVMLYTGFDGTNYAIGQAVENGSGIWERVTSDFTVSTRPLLTAVEDTFSNEGTRIPVAIPTDDGRFDLWYAGFDRFRSRIGVAGTDLREAFPRHKWARSGDAIDFMTRYGVFGQDAIPLVQTIDGFNVPGVRAGGSNGADGPNASTYDAERGMIYLAAKLYPQGDNIVVVVDVRDDSDEDFTDLNFMDIETIWRFSNAQGSVGFFDLELDHQGLLYMSTRRPDGVLIADVTQLEDNATKEVTKGLALGALPMRNHEGSLADRGPETDASIGAYAVEYIEGTNLLMVSHFRDNSVSFFDLTRGIWGEEISYVGYLQDSPSAITVSPDGKWAVVAHYVGSVDSNNLASSELLLIDLDPASETYLQARTRVVNQ